MSIVVHVPDELVGRLTTEAACRGISVEELAAELLGERLANPGPDTSALDAFIGSGSSGRSEPFDIHQARAELAQQVKPAETALT